MRLKLNTLVYKFFTVLAFASLLMLGQITLPSLVVSNATVGEAYAQSNTESKKPKKRRRTPALRERVFRKIAEAEELINAEKYAEARKLLDGLLSDDSLNSTENAQTWSYYGFIYATQEKYSQAIDAYKNVLRHGDNISEAIEQNTLLIMSQIYLTTEKYSLAVGTLNQYLALTGPNPSAYEYLAQAYYSQDNFKQAVKYAALSIDLVKKQAGKPKENMFLILRAGYYELGDFVKVTEVLEELVTLYPKGEYFANLAAMYGERDLEAKQLAVYEAAYDSGLLSRERDLIAVASLLLQNDVPHKAALILETGMKKGQIKETVQNLKLLSSAWYSAQEPHKSVKVLSQAAEKDDEGDLYAHLANSYAALENWKMAVKSVNQAFKKGKVKNPGSAYVTLGLALFNMDDLDGAVKAFESALKYKKIESYAQQMINYLQREKLRRQRLANSLS